MLQKLSILSEDECQKALKSIHSLRSFWSKRGEHLAAPFFTLGAASYLDASKDSESYYELAQQYNVVLESYFKWLYRKLEKQLSEALGLPVKPAPGLALPGFHIFLASKIFEKPVASLHLDLQYQLVDWKDKTIDPESPISFTLAIQLPSQGGGLWTWDVYKKDTEGLDSDAIYALLANKERQYLPYSPGQLVLHSGHMYHQIAPMKDSQAGDERITLQGHGIRSENEYLIYW